MTIIRSMPNSMNMELETIFNLLSKLEMNLPPLDIQLLNMIKETELNLTKFPL